ncbi:MAG: DUF1266 domain-containing protein [Fusobacteriaceae bacterium]|nr:DUF1266 domain-containing protein [Fusobacteriaceae bacterium]
MFSSIEYMFIKNYNFFNKNLSTNDTKLITLLAMDFVNIEKEKNILQKLNLMFKNKNLEDRSSKNYYKFLETIKIYISSFSDISIIEENSDKAKKILKKTWGLKNRESIFKALNFLKKNGVRRELHSVFNKFQFYDELNIDEVRNYIKDLLETSQYISFSYEIEEFESLSDKELLKTQFYKKLENDFSFIKNEHSNLFEYGITGWDMTNYVNLLKLAYKANYLKIDECWILLEKISKECHHLFKDWKTFSESYLLGRRYALKNDKDYKRFEYICFKLQNDKLSIWNHFLWNDV